MDEGAPHPAHRTNAAETGPGHGHVPSYVVVVLAVSSTLLAVVTLYSLWAFWPTDTLAKPQHVSWFGLHRTLSRALAQGSSPAPGTWSTSRTTCSSARPARTTGWA